MMKNVEIAIDQGLIKAGHGTLVDLSEARQYDDDEICYIVTGSQGENRAALWNMATSTYKGLEIDKGDTVVLSARIIPGNEKNISRLIGHLYKRGANIIEEKRRLVHVSGHASQEDIRIMVETARPKYLVPIHGEYRMLFRHKEFVKNHVAGYHDDNIVLIENGDLLEIDVYGARVVEKHELHRTFIDEESMGEIEYDVVRERKKLAYGGAVSLVVTVDKGSHKLVGEPQITFNGVAGMADISFRNGSGANDADRNVRVPPNGFNAAARQAISDAVGEMKRDQIADKAVFKENLRIHLKRFVQKELGTKPVIVTTIVEV
jgi:ribonuclease J